MTMKNIKCTVISLSHFHEKLETCYFDSFGGSSVEGYVQARAMQCSIL